MSNLLVEFGLSLIANENNPLSDEIKEQIRSALLDFISNPNPSKSIKTIQCFANGETVLERLKAIQSCADTIAPPIPYNVDEYNDNLTRKKTRTWTINEDNRLIYAVYKYGVSNWPAVSDFVGYGRKKSQCSQRWIRVLDPKISRSHWTTEEEEKLLLFYEMYGDKNWMKIAVQMGNRSDVQCRYHYQQLFKKEQIWKQKDKKTKENPFTVLDLLMPKKVEEISASKHEIEVLNNPLQLDSILNWNPFDSEPTNQKNDLNDFINQTPDLNANFPIDDSFWI
ncbi:Myb-like DNA-binding domain containing protein [Histomonas meleagridis]|uniref:Myb-like DNA-binding domain containing protein n=1 Tax=Histomonas meleagridis TaxID=135588 RepID=UPI0035599952|nr:Myb-like DNA-binding domain containing protein [Histomonas meleagridis]KAH0805835.1 Myb-like DNA-binding domain containing protein [Histomonas meleagridis]